jgi:formylglycine-generating enzyme required for sulfatase activity
LFHYYFNRWGRICGDRRASAPNPPNHIGLCDMRGNVWQWCEARAPGSTEVAGRGGMYSSEAPDCRTSSRRLTRPSFHDHTRGFRLVRVPEAK